MLWKHIARAGVAFLDPLLSPYSHLRTKPRQAFNDATAATNEQPVQRGSFVVVFFSQWSVFVV